MDIVSTLQALLLGLVEGVTEFLPISSTGHLILLIDILEFSAPPGKVFEVVIQLGAILAIMWLYRQRFWQLTRYAYRPEERRFILLLFLGFLPAAIVGATLHGFIKSVLFSPLVVSVMLVVGGIIILLVERKKPTPRLFRSEDISYKQALAIGCFQALAVIPGTSRSGATIIGGLLLGLDRRTAAEFSFFLAVPTMLAATAYDLFKNWHSMTSDGIELIAVGFLSAFVAALASVRMLMALISRHGFGPFGYYRIILGSVMLVLLLA